MFAIIDVLESESCCMCDTSVIGIAGAEVAIRDDSPGPEDFPRIPTDSNVRVFCDAHFKEEGPERLYWALRILGESVIFNHECHCGYKSTQRSCPEHTTAGRHTLIDGGIEKQTERERLKLAGQMTEDRFTKLEAECIGLRAVVACLQNRSMP